MEILRALIGICVMIGICYLLSTDRKAINWRLVVSGLALQFVLALLMLKIPFINAFFAYIVRFFILIIDAAQLSAQFLFGDLAVSGGPFGFAFTVLPVIIFFSALSSALYYFGILQKVVYAFAWIMNRTMQLTGAESLAVAANVFIGQTEAPLVVKPYLEKMTRSEILCLMTGGMATIAGSVYGAYIALLGGETLAGKEIFGVHLLTASIISAPAAIVAAKLLYPETESSTIQEEMKMADAEEGSNFLDALSKGTTDGLYLAVNVGAMLLSFMAFIYLSNAILLQAGEWLNLNEVIERRSEGAYEGLSMQYILGYLFAPFAWLLGIQSDEIIIIGQLLGEKTILNEFVAYVSLSNLIGQGILSEKSVIIATYALCGFANFASIGIQIGGISAIAPGQRKNLTELGIRSLIGGTIACFLTAIIAGVLV